MEVICGKADLKGNFTNHSGKTSLATRLYQAGVLEQLIMDRTGHRSEKGAKAYKRPSETMLKDVLNPSSSVKKEKCETYSSAGKENEKNDTRSAEYSENIGLSFEYMRNKVVGPFGNNTFDNCTFNFNTKNQFGLTEHVSTIKFVYL